MKILIAYDGSAPARAAVDEVVRRPWPASTQVHLVTVVERPLSVPPPDGFEGYTPLFERICASLREEATRQLRPALTRLAGRPELTASSEVLEGVAKEKLLEAIVAWKADLVFAGLDSKDASAGRFPGSVCYGLVVSAPCSVEIVKPPAAA